jgi:dipeptidyl aminopeptidase/acylaminoacyl peptidase
MDIRARHLLAAALTAWAASAPAASTPRKDDLTEPFLEPPGYFDAALAPGGVQLAMITYEGESGARVTMVNLDKQTSWLLPLRATLEATADAKAVKWLHAPRRVAWMSDFHIAVDYDKLDSMGTISHTYQPLGGRYLGMARVDGQAEREAIVAESGTGTIKRMSAKDHVLHAIGDSLPGGAVARWIPDDSGTIRIVQAKTSVAGSKAPHVTTLYRSDEHDPWHSVDERSLIDDAFVPIGVTDKSDEILVLSRNGGDRTAAWRYDVVKHAYVEQVAARPDADVTLVERRGDGGSILAVTSEGLNQETLWLDAGMKQLQAAVDAVLPNHVNRLQAGASSRVLVESVSDTDPGVLYVLDSRTMKMERIAQKRPAIKPARMQEMQRMRYPARDGLQVPAYLTLPGKPVKPVPLIVLVHGGPQERDHWGWNEEVQVYAAHGYAVFQPQFRGSSGFGKHHEEAGYGQWGLAMQDDITDGVHWLVEHGIADPARVCIVGASYGGYAVLRGLIKDPELYKCGVSVAGVSDLERELTAESDLSKSSDLVDVIHWRIGDPAQMHARFDEVSPLKHAAQVKAPLLLVHGALDERVPLSQGKDMADALQALHADVTWLEFPDEAHGIAHPENRRAYYAKVFELLKRTIGPGDPPSDH